MIAKNPALALLLLMTTAGFALAQNTPSASPPPHVPLQKTIGQSRPHVVPSLIVMNARGATLDAGKLTLIGLSPNSIVFADRPVRAAGHDLTSRLMEQWAPANTSPGSFTRTPPNATVSVFSRDGSAVRDAVVVLKTPKLEGDRVTFDVDVLEGDLAGGDGPASIFIDTVGLRLPPEPYPGANTRNAYRGSAWYAGAAVDGGVAAAVAAAPAYPFQPTGCGRYGQPICY